ncbi:unnamed protein product [Linum tenue]|uniref:DUF668 domain-containing protein n=1 Tax=Linum tenue TaxID=586396 RepID=A0AAV0HF09_9ROSI|nr:unnamed protein product [Linum tenue]CAI0465542.1 unnamed protein product [Linum tenue]
MNQHEESRKAFEQKVVWQKQDVRHLKDVSIWNQSYDKIVELLVRTVCTIYARICAVFGESMLHKENSSCSISSLSPNSKDECWEVSGQLKRPIVQQKKEANNKVRPHRVDSRKLTIYAPQSTLGGSALALHYANVIIVIEKLLQYPHLVGEEARDDLYHMLPTSLRLSLRKKLKSYVKNLAIYDAPLAHDWKESIDGMLKWLAPLAHNMMRWQSERNFEQHQIVAKSNVLLLQTLYFADRAKTEAAICELLVGLNYICRYEQQQNALLDCASSFDFEDCMEWQMQCRAAYFN